MGVLTLYYFPVKFLEALGPELRRISITFIHKLMKANGIQTVLDEDDTDYVLIWLSEEVPDETAEERRKRLKLLRSYENGKVQALLRRVENRCYYKNLPKALDRYEPQNDYERSLVSAMKEGLDFCHRSMASCNTVTTLSMKRSLNACRCISTSRSV